MSLYLALIYTDKHYYDMKGLIKAAEVLYNIQMNEFMNRRGILKRFSMPCYGKQHILTDSRIKKTEKYFELKDKKGSEEYEKWFLRYEPAKIALKEAEKALSKKLKQTKRNKSKNKTNKTLKNKKTPEEKKGLKSLITDMFKF
jgi:hypothetical protein